MGFWVYMTCMACLIPITMIGFGRYFMKTAPKNINYIFGYRTARSMKNNETWVFAHKYCGKIWFYGGIVLLIISLITMLFTLGKEINTIGYIGAACSVVPIIVMFVAIILTEKALKANFNEYGQRKNRS